MTPPDKSGSEGGPGGSGEGPGTRGFRGNGGCRESCRRTRDRAEARHFRGLNGIRALSVLAIIAFHSGLSWIPGGYYGVDAFFVLSGFLITALLLAEWGASGRIGLRRFWGRRARRLLPALFLLVAVIGVVMATLPGVFSTPDAFESAFWTVFYGSNWYLVHAGVPYFSLSSQPSPWTHTWSLAIEEQFYLLWPIVLLAVLGLGARQGGARPSLLNRIRHFRPTPAPIDRGRAKRRRLHFLFVLACVGVLASAALMAHSRSPRLQRPGLLRHRHPRPGASRWRSHRGGNHALGQVGSGDLGRCGLLRVWPSRAWPERLHCGRPLPRRRPSPFGEGSWRPAWLRARWSSDASSHPARSSCAFWSCRRCHSWAASHTECTSGTGQCCS